MKSYPEIKQFITKEDVKKAINLGKEFKNRNIKSYSELEQELNELIKERKTKELIRDKLLKQVKETDLGINQVTFHKEWYDTN